MNTILARIETLYVRLRKEQPHRLRDTGPFYDSVARELQGILLAAEADGDALWARPALLATHPFPPVLYVSQDGAPDDRFLLAHEDGLNGLDDSTPLGVYRLDHTARVKITVEAETVTSADERRTPQ